jgi:ferric enterobactin receptor
VRRTSHGRNARRHSFSTDVTLQPSSGDSPAQADSVMVAGDGRRVELRPSQALVPGFVRGDVFRTLQFLPGASGTLDNPSELYVRGGTPDQTLITFDGFTMYPYAHAFGSVGALNMDAVRSAEFSDDTFDGPGGGRLSGALRFTGESSPHGKPSAAVDVSGLGLRTRVSLPLGGRGAFLLAARRSPPPTMYNDVLNQWYGQDVPYARDRAVRFSGGVLPASPQSGFYDVNGKLDVNVAPRDRLSLTFYEGRDVANTSHDNSLPARPDLGELDPLAPPPDTQWQIGRIQKWTARGVSGVWRRRWSSDATTSVSVGHSEFSLASDQSSLLTRASTGADVSLAGSRGGSGALAESNRITDTTVRFEHSIALGFAHVVSVGGEITALDADYDVRRETVSHAASGLSTATLADLLAQHDAGRYSTAFVHDAWRPIGRLVVSPAARISRYDLASSTFFEPRVSAVYYVVPWVRLTGGWAIDHQPATRIVREDLLQGDGEFWALANGSTIPVARAQQVGVGAGADVSDARIDARAYYKRFDGLTMFAARLFPGIAPEAGTDLFHQGSGKAIGLQFSVQHNARRNSLWTTYAVGRVEYTYPMLEASTFPASFDRTHELTITDSARMGASWTIRAAWMLASGRPETPAQGVEPVWFPTGDTVYRVAFGPKNSTRLPAYHRLDVSTERDFRFQAVTTTLGATVFNAYNHANIAYREYGVAGTALATNAVASIGRAIDVFVRVGF